jgi:alpha-beta hydrolase superfamily lysophospholipase
MRDGGRRVGADSPHGQPVRLLRLLLPVVAVSLVAVAVHRIEPAAAGAFYDPPDPLPPGPPGTLIRSEPVLPAPAGARVWRILYVSSDPAGDAIAVSGIVVAPDAPAPPAGRAVVAWAHPTSGIESRCAPSPRDGGGAAAIPGLDALLAAGHVVAATDYAGLGTPGTHPYLVGESEARAVLDSVRAARALPDAGASGPSTPTAVWGHSQGGHAALFAAQLAPSYAPDVPLAGVATAAPATDLTALLQHGIGGVPGNVLASMALVAWSQLPAAGRAQLPLDGILDPLAVPTARRIASRCIEGGGPMAVDLPDAEILRLRFRDPQPWFTPGWDDLLTENTPTLRSGQQSSPPGTSAAATPVLINQGTADTVVWRDVTAAWAAAQCARGAALMVVDYDGASHVDIASRSAEDAVAWINDRLAGRPAGSTCEPR